MASEKNGKQIESFPSAAFKQNSKHSRMAGKLNKFYLYSLNKFNKTVCFSF